MGTKLPLKPRQVERLGWRPDTPDERDFRYAIPYHLQPKLPVSTSLSMGTTYDQGNLGSCTANAIAKLIDYDEQLQHKKAIKPSRLFIYYNERVIENSVSSDAGAEIRDGIKTIAQAGVCHETLWPYKIAKFAQKPTASCYLEAKKYTAVNYARVNQNTNDMKLVLYGGRPIVIGFTVYDNFWNVGSDGIAELPSGAVAGGHAVAVSGYDDSIVFKSTRNKGGFLLQNSWGSSWGKKGYFYLPYEYLTDPNLAGDFWVVQTVS